MNALRIAILLGSVSGLIAQATAGPRCNVPMEAWKHRQALEDKLTAEGWQVRRIKTDDGCYKVEGARPDGVRVKATFEPDTLTLIREKSRED